MYNVFKTIVQFNIQACFIVLAIIILRLILKKAPRSLICALWTLVAVRLIFPFRIESVFSLVPDTEITARTFGSYATERITSAVWEYPETFLHTTDNTVIKEKTDTLWNILPRIAAGIWAAGVAVMLIYAIVSYLRLYRMTRENMMTEKGVYICDRIPSPFILGIIRPKIFLPSNISEHDKPFVLAHEKAHIKRKDHLWKPLGFLLLSVYWFNPLLWAAYILLCRDIESACDEKVIKELGSECKKPYAIALINSAASQKLISACPLAFGETNVKTRIKNVLSYKKPAFWIIIIAVVLSIAVAVCFLTNPINKEKLQPDNVYEFEYGDIDGDGKEELVTLSLGSSSGIATTELRAYDAGTLEQKYPPTVLNHESAYEPTLKNDGDRLYIEGYNLFTAADPNTNGDDVYYRCMISVDDGVVALADIEALGTMEPYEAVEKFFKANVDKFPMNPSNQDKWTWANVRDEYYGGTYYDGAVQVILLTDISQQNDYMPVGRDIRFQKCEYSLEHLESEIDRINQELAKFRVNGEGYSDSIVELSLLDNQNKIEVCIYDMTDEKEKWFKDSFGDLDYFVLRSVTERPNEDAFEETINNIPAVIFTNGETVYISGDCGIIFYDIENGQIKGMLSSGYLKELGFEKLYACASPNGEKIYLYDLSEVYDPTGEKRGVFDLTNGTITTQKLADGEDEEFFGFDSVAKSIKPNTLVSMKSGTTYTISVPWKKLKNMILTVKTADGKEKEYKIFE